MGINISQMACPIINQTAKYGIWFSKIVKFEMEFSGMKQPKFSTIT